MLEYSDERKEVQMSNTLSSGRETSLSPMRNSIDESATPRPSLIDIFERYSNLTDKLTAHQYPYIYQEIFEPVRHLPVRLLEIGIALGGSISCWQEYFPQGTIYAIDIENEFVERVRNLDRVEGYRLDAGNLQQLRSWQMHQPNMDFVIDDGSHRIHDITNAFSVLWPNVTPGGWYFIEDAAQCNTPNTPSTLMHKIETFAEDTMFNQNDAISVTFWPNLIAIQKRGLTDNRAAIRGTL